MKSELSLTKRTFAPFDPRLLSTSQLLDFVRETRNFTTSLFGWIGFTGAVGLASRHWLMPLLSPNAGETTSQALTIAVAIVVLFAWLAETLTHLGNKQAAMGELIARGGVLAPAANLAHSGQRPVAPDWQ
jgi:hypothetical protein